MNDPIEISETARETGQRLTAFSATVYSQPSKYSRLAEVEVQLAINQAAADKDKVIEELMLELKSWILAAFNCGLYKADVPHNTAQLWQMAQVDASSKLLQRCDQLQQQVLDLQKDKIGLKCTCGEPHISHRVVHRYDGKPCYISDV